jgi:hypothetical protein
VIIVVEGASAAGKTTWCRRMPRDRVLFEGEPPVGPAPPGASDRLPPDSRAVAEYWAEENARRWSMARDIADRLGWVVCDTDPFKLHWSWTLWVTGLSSSEYWQRCREFTRQAFEDGKLGLPDLVFLSDLDVETLRRQKAADPTRTRSRHEMHILIAPALKCWYRAMAALDPTRVEFRLPVDGLEARHLRLGRRVAGSGAATFDRFMCELENVRAS